MNAPLANRTVLVVDDDEVLRDVFRELLGDCGYMVHTAANGVEALDRILSLPAPPGLILLDLSMPVMDGWQVLEWLEASDALRRIPVVVVSHCKPPPIGLCVVRKPVKVEVLVLEVEKHCGPVELAQAAPAVLEVLAKHTR